MNELKISTVGIRSSRWGEGPIYWKNHLIYVDIEGHSLIKLNPETRNEQVWEMGERIGTVVPTDGEDFICAGDLVFIDLIPLPTKKQTSLIQKQGKDQIIVLMMASVIQAVDSGQVP